MPLIHPGWLVLAFIIGALAALIFIATRGAKPGPSKRQRALFLAMRTAMDDTRRLTEEFGPREFLNRIDVLRSVPIEQVTRSAHRAKLFLHETLMAIQVLETLGVEPCPAVHRAWNRTLYAGKDLVLTVVYPAEDEMPGAEPAEKGAAS